MSERRYGLEMNCFETHGLEHLSPSTCNTFAASPAAFVLEKLLGRKSPVGVAAHRGTAVEAGVACGLMGSHRSDAVREARETFSRLTALSADPNRDKENAALEGMVNSALDELEPYGPPTSTQGKIEWMIEGIPVPMIGFYDFEWANHCTLVDLKTTHYLPSKIKTPHARQVSLYYAARPGLVDARLCYATSKKCAVYLLDSPEEHLKALENIARSMMKFLSVSTDPMELAHMVAPDVDSFYFGTPEARRSVYEVWGI